MRRQPITCQTCGAGELIMCKRYRMSVPVVLIGYILLLPSLLGIAGLLVAFVVPLIGGTERGDWNRLAEPVERARVELLEAGLSEEAAEAVVTREGLSQPQLDELTPEQRQAVGEITARMTAELEHAAMIAAAEATGTVLFIFPFLCASIALFVSGLLGWLLIMKKRVLECNNCRATIAAS